MDPISLEIVDEKLFREALGEPAKKTNHIIIVSAMINLIFFIGLMFLQFLYMVIYDKASPFIYGIIIGLIVINTLFLIKKLRSGKKP